MHSSSRVLLAVIVVAGFCTTSAPRAGAQWTSRIEAGANYTLVRSNAPAGGCGCFFMNGGGAWFAYPFYREWSAVGEVAAVRAPSIGAGKADLTLVSYLAGPRYDWRHRWRYSSRVTPFGQLLLGGVHASGTLAPGYLGTPGGPDTFGMTAGGGLDVRLTSRWALRAFQADYFLTRFNNIGDNRQNSLRISFGAIYHFGKE